MANIQDREADLFDHLDELRKRIIRAIVYIAVGGTVAWFLYDGYIYKFLMGPIANALKINGIKPMYQQITEPFMIQFQASLVAGIVLASPLVTLELWGFVKPALTKEERRPIRWVAPLSILLFLMGVTMAYVTMPAAVRWLLSYVPSGAEFRPNVAQNQLFMVKMLLAFGLVFELPVVLLFLAKVQVISSSGMKQYWRQAVVGIATLAAVATPSNDWFTMSMMALPLVILYLLSIFLVQIIERR